MPTATCMLTWHCDTTDLSAVFSFLKHNIPMLSKQGVKHSASTTHLPARHVMLYGDVGQGHDHGWYRNPTVTANKNDLGYVICFCFSLWEGYNICCMNRYTTDKCFLRYADNPGWCSQLAQWRHAIGLSVSETSRSVWESVKGQNHNIKIGIRLTGNRWTQWMTKPVGNRAAIITDICILFMLLFNKALK